MSQEIIDKLQGYGFAHVCSFIPFEYSRNKDEKYPSLNWEISLYFQKQLIHRFPYMQGSGHCSAYKKPITFSNGKLDDWATDRAIREECSRGIVPGTRKHVPSPTLDEVMYCLVSDASGASETFKEWCSNYGYNDDSQKAFRVYKECQQTRLALLRTGVLPELELLFENY